jgi:hypothetical protein
MHILILYGSIFFSILIRFTLKQDEKYKKHMWQEEKMVRIKNCEKERALTPARIQSLMERTQISHPAGNLR